MWVLSLRWVGRSSLGGRKQLLFLGIDLPTLFLDGDDVARAPLIAERSIPGKILAISLFILRSRS